MLFHCVQSEFLFSAFRENEQKVSIAMDCHQLAQCFVLKERNISAECAIKAAHLGPLCLSFLLATPGVQRYCQGCQETVAYGH